ncbi:MAG: helix-turn-helix transcriptional regulator [Verrucomicrobiae bacterium]|nr:helix-turn-helix transcriptional regulator [Verrucomicrobiae bacterium]
MARRHLTEAALELIAARFRVLGEPMRLRLLIALEEGERNVTELVEAVGATQANVSRHMRTLTEAGLVERRKEGLNAYYRIAEPEIFELCGQVCGSLRRRHGAQAKSLGLEG